MKGLLYKLKVTKLVSSVFILHESNTASAAPTTTSKSTNEVDAKLVNEFRCVKKKVKSNRRLGKKSVKKKNNSSLHNIYYRK